MTDKNVSEPEVKELDEVVVDEKDLDELPAIIKEDDFHDDFGDEHLHEEDEEEEDDDDDAPEETGDAVWSGPAI